MFPVAWLIFITITNSFFSYIPLLAIAGMSLGILQKKYSPKMVYGLLILGTISSVVLDWSKRTQIQYLNHNITINVNKKLPNLDLRDASGNKISLERINQPILMHVYDKKNDDFQRQRKMLSKLINQNAGYKIISIYSPGVEGLSDITSNIPSASDPLSKVNFYETSGNLERIVPSAEFPIILVIDNNFNVQEIYKGMTAGVELKIQKRLKQNLIAFK